MLTEPQILAVVALSFLAFVIKSVATFGPGVILVPLGALIIGAREIVIVVGLLDLVSNISLLKLDKDSLPRAFWVPMVIAMVVGSILGAAMLVFVPAEYFDLMFGLLLVPLGIWFMIRGGEPQDAKLSGAVPAKASKSDLTTTFVSGCMGGLAGITGPAMAWRLGRVYSKDTFRIIMIPVLLASAVTRVTAYTAAGLVTIETISMVLLCIPGLYLGLWAGNRLFLRVPQKWFSRIIGALITISGVKLLTK